MFSKRRCFFIKLIGLFSLFLNLELGSDIWALNDSNEKRPLIEFPINKKFQRVQQDMQDIMNYLTSVQNQSKISVQKRPQLAIAQDSISFEISFGDAKEQQLALSKQKQKDLQSKLDKTLQENTDLTNRVEHCTAEKTSLEKQLKQLQKEKDDLQNKNSKIQQRNENISKLKKLLGEQKDEIDSLLKQKEKIKKSLEQKHLMQTSVLEKQVQDLSQNIAVLTKEAHQKNAEACEMKGSLKTSQDENKRLQIENEVLKGANSTLASSAFSALGSIMDGIDQAFLWSDSEETESDPDQDSPSSKKQENLQESLLIQIFQLLAKEAHLVFVQTLASYLNIPFKSHLRPFLDTFHTKEIRARIFASQDVQEQISIFKENQSDNAFGLKNYLKGLDDAQHLFKSYNGFIQQYQDILYRQGFLEEEDK